MKKINKLLGLTSVRKKVFFLSKLAGLIMVLFYIFTDELPSSTDMRFIIWFVLLVGVIMGVDFLLGRFITTPLNKINESARQMAELDFNAKCNISADDEFGELSKNLNVMFLNLKEALSEIETANKQLEQDVIKEQRLLVQRKELVDNLSHEMKTPLGVIRAYAEGLKDETDEQKKQYYIDIISTSADHMNDLIVSLLDLSALEAGGVTFNDEHFDFVELTETVAGRLLIDTPKANYNFTFELPEEKIFISADKFRIEQVLSNLILNAKSHVVDNGKIHLSLIIKGNKLLCNISNEGNLLTEEDLSKVWMKFYRTEATKGKNVKGSGLGLSIVSEILSKYQSNFGAVNQDKGVSFYFDFPIVK